MKYISLILLSIVFFIGGCNTTPKPSQKIVQLVGECSDRYISIEDLKGRIKDDGFMQAQVRGKNLTNNYIKVEYKIVWLDENDFTIDTILSNWSSVPAYANQPFYINLTSPNTKSKSFNLYLKKEGKTTLCQQQNYQ
ncbi:MAG: YcfL family protein [Campylobacterota bacterium]|nr:YcfL family protein [Campylobacterota bacterium]